MAARHGYTFVKIFLDTESLIPPYEQLRSQIATLIASGALRPEDRLPAIRQLAADLGIASGTVARAYRELETLGLVRARRRGTFVCVDVPQKTSESAQATEGSLVRAAEAFALTAWQLRVSPKQALATVRETLTRYPTQR